jgi:hypothetical protein
MTSPSSPIVAARSGNLAFAPSVHIKMYGEQFEIVSDPFDDGDCIAVRATSGNNAEIRTLRLPVAILVGQEDRFLKRPGVLATQRGRKRI